MAPTSSNGKGKMPARLSTPSTPLSVAASTPRSSKRRLSSGHSPKVAVIGNTSRISSSSRASSNMLTEEEVAMILTNMSRHDRTSQDQRRASMPSRYLASEQPTGRPVPNVRKPVQPVREPIRSVRPIRPAPASDSGKSVARSSTGSGSRSAPSPTQYKPMAPASTTSVGSMGPPPERPYMPPTPISYEVGNVRLPEETPLVLPTVPVRSEVRPSSTPTTRRSVAETSEAATATHAPAAARPGPSTSALNEASSAPVHGPLPQVSAPRAFAPIPLPTPSPPPVSDAPPAQGFIYVTNDVPMPAPPPPVAGPLIVNGEDLFARAGTAAQAIVAPSTRAQAIAAEELRLVQMLEVFRDATDEVLMGEVHPFCNPTQGRVRVLDAPTNTFGASELFDELDFQTFTLSGPIHKRISVEAFHAVGRSDLLHQMSLEELAAMVFAHSRTWSASRLNVRGPSRVGGQVDYVKCRISSVSPNFEAPTHLLTVTSSSDRDQESFTIPVHDIVYITQCIGLPTGLFTASYPRRVQETDGSYTIPLPIARLRVPHPACFKLLDDYLYRRDLRYLLYALLSPKRFDPLPSNDYENNIERSRYFITLLATMLTFQDIARRMIAIYDLNQNARAIGIIDSGFWHICNTSWYVAGAALKLKKRHMLEYKRLRVESGRNLTAGRSLSMIEPPSDWI